MSIRTVIKKIQIPVAILIGTLTFVNETFDIFTKVHFYIISSKNEKSNLKNESIFIRIEKGETKYISETDLFQITIDDILPIEGTHLYNIIGKFNNGFITDRIIEKTQGESMQFDRYIIQITRITIDYVEFRITLNNNH